MSIQEEIRKFLIEDTDKWCTVLTKEHDLLISALNRIEELEKELDSTSVKKHQKILDTKLSINVDGRLLEKIISDIIDGGRDE